MGPAAVQVHPSCPEVQKAINQVVGNFSSPTKMLTREDGGEKNGSGMKKIMYKFSCPVVLLPGHEEKEERRSMLGPLHTLSSDYPPTTTT